MAVLASQHTPAEGPGLSPGSWSSGLSARAGRRYDAVSPPSRSWRGFDPGESRPPMSIDLLVFGPHPDDAEIGAGATLRKAKALGHTTGIVDMTTGDMGWGTPEARLEECAQAARILQ